MASEPYLKSCLLTLIAHKLPSFCQRCVWTLTTGMCLGRFWNLVFTYLLSLLRRFVFPSLRTSDQASLEVDSQSMHSVACVIFHARHRRALLELFCCHDCYQTFWRGIWFAIARSSTCLCRVPLCWPLVWNRSSSNLRLMDWLLWYFCIPFRIEACQPVLEWQRWDRLLWCNLCQRCPSYQTSSWSFLTISMYSLFHFGGSDSQMDVVP